MNDVPHDTKERQRYLEKYASRAKTVPKAQREVSEVIVFKAPFSPQLLQMRMKTQIDDLLQQLRSCTGNGFLARSKVIIAHPMQRNAFIDTYKFNFIRTFERNMGGREGHVCDYT